MKQFDPDAGWSDPKSAPPHSRIPELTEPAVGRPADVYHFNRHGRRLSINAQEAIEDDLAFDKTAETADLILQLFDRLEQVDKTKEVLLRLSSSLQAIDALQHKEKDLAAQLQATRDEIDALRERIQSDMSSAQAVEDNNLKIRQYRKALLSKLANQLAPSVQKSG
jgi:predicted ArsR family transcriptional regulator